MNKFVSNTVASIVVYLKNGSSVRISFNPSSNGGSTFYTDDDDIIAALRKHHRFGKLFREDSTSVSQSIAEAENTEEDDDSAPVVVKVSDAGDAKDYLSERFGISRTKLKSIEKIKEAAAANNITFIGLE